MNIQTQNKKLKRLIKLSSHIRVFVPSTVNVNEAIDNTSFVNDVQISLVQFFGGATIYNAFGAWQGLNIQIVSERITIIESYTTTDKLNEKIDSVIDICEKLKNDMKQESIALEINGELYFI